MQSFCRRLVRAPVNNQTDFYTRNHWWCDFSSKKCGVTHNFFDPTVPEQFVYKPSIKKGLVRPGDIVGTLYYLCPIRRETTALTLTSPFSGLIESVNLRPTRSNLWLYKAKIIQADDNLMDHLTYQSHNLLA